MTKNNHLYQNLPVILTVIMTGLILFTGGAAAAHISIGNIAVDNGGTATADVILDGVPLEGLSGYFIDLRVANPSVAEISNVVYPTTLSGLTDTTPVPFTSGHIGWVDLNDVIPPKDPRTNLVLATITIHGLAVGSTTLGTEFSDLTGDGGELFIPVSSISTPAIVVTGGTAQPRPTPVALPGHALPSDPDNNGLYDDMNGDGLITFDDVRVFFDNYHWIQQYQPVSSFDFNGNGMVDFGDIVVLNTMR